MRRLPILIAALLVIGCSARKDEAAPSVKPTAPPKVQPSNSSTPKAQEQPVYTVAELFPLKERNEWTYDAQIDGRTVGEMTWRVKTVKDTPGGTEAVIDLITGELVEQQQWLQNESGLYQVSGGAERLRNDPPQPIFRPPFTAGAKTTYAGVGHTMSGEKGTIRTESEILGMKDADTSMGKMKALAVETHSVYIEPEGTTEATITSWYSPGVGLVRYKMEVKGAGTTLLLLRKTNVK